MFYDSFGQILQCPIIRYKSKTNPNGPKIVLTCLNHGDEVIGVDTAFRLLDFLKQNDELFSGEIIIFSSLNYQGFLQSSRMFEGENQNSTSTPNLNRKWPGDDNSYAGRWAKNIFDQILELQPDFVLDLHSYASNSLVHVIVDRPGGQMEQDLIDICSLSKVPFYLEYEAETFAAQSLDKSLSNQLCLAGISSLTVELGPKQGFDLQSSDKAFEALRNLFISLGGLSNVEISNQFENTQIDQKQNYFRHGIYSDSGFSGYYRPLVEIGKFIHAGQVVAEVVNLLGQVVWSIKMPTDGYVIALEDVAVVYPMKQIGVFISQY